MDIISHLSVTEQQRIRQLSEQFVRIPLNFATPVYFGEFWKDASDARINNGTATLLRLNGRQFCITNHHVIKAYRELKFSDDRIAFQIGNIQIEPENHLVSESEKFDLVVLDISDFPESDIATRGEVPTQFLEASNWPPQAPNVGDFVMFGGYPGYWRDVTGKREIRFDTFSSGASEVHTSRSDTIICRLQLDLCIHHTNVDGRDSPGALTGLSGGPVLIERQSEAGISTFELVGIIYEYSESLDLLHIRPISLISDGGIISDELIV